MVQNDSICCCFTCLSCYYSGGSMIERSSYLFERRKNLRISHHDAIKRIFATLRSYKVGTVVSQANECRCNVLCLFGSWRMHSRSKKHSSLCLVGYQRACTHGACSAMDASSTT